MCCGEPCCSAVVARTQLLRLDLGPLLGLSCLRAAAQAGQGVLLSLLVLAFDQPGCGTSRLRADRGATADAVAARVADRRGVAREARVAVGREVLVKLVDVKGLDVGDDIAAELTDVHVAEVDVELAPAGAFGQRADAPFTL